MPNKKKLQEKIQLLECELREAKQLNKTTLSQMQDTKTQANTAKKHLSGSERCRENEVLDLREDLKEKDKQNSKLRTVLGNMELLAGRLEKEKAALKRKDENAQTLLKAQVSKTEEQVSKAEDLVEQLADAQDFIALAR
ncbi:hypothetical protein DL98DRAFT_586710 [Cadophora sp. DSE1049]|nr:hypothetical protein DL98DRAFT_586710 [Cadophora sp. DSE1049]